MQNDTKIFALIKYVVILLGALLIAYLVDVFHVSYYNALDSGKNVSAWQYFSLFFSVALMIIMVCRGIIKISEKRTNRRGNP